MFKYCTENTVTVVLQWGDVMQCTLKFNSRDIFFDVACTCSLVIKVHSLILSEI